jgi:beta-glucosidase/6-phospho-beta-glucosidase/beta-galactosidase
MRFGLIRVDFATQERAWRKSAHWYRERIRR